MTNLAEAPADPSLDAASNQITLVPATEGPLGPVMFGVMDARLNINVALDVEAIEAGVEALGEEGAIGGNVELLHSRTLPPNEPYQGNPSDEI